MNTFDLFRSRDKSLGAEMTSNSDKNRSQHNNGKQKDLWVNQQVRFTLH